MKERKSIENIEKDIRLKENIIYSIAILWVIGFCICGIITPSNISEITNINKIMNLVILATSLPLVIMLKLWEVYDEAIKSEIRNIKNNTK